MMMESALKSAASYMSSVAVTKPEAVTVANWLEAGRQAYKAILFARQNKMAPGAEKALKESKERARASNQQADDDELPF